MTKSEALTAAEAVEAQFDAVVAWRDGGFGSLRQVARVGAYQVDTGESYQALQQAVALTIGFLVQVSFQVVPEKAVVLDRPRTILDLGAELYGADFEGKLDLLINSNNLTGSEMLEIPRGKRIKYYPAPS
jgi:hypothetical protein